MLRRLAFCRRGRCWRRSRRARERGGGVTMERGTLAVEERGRQHVLCRRYTIAFAQGGSPGSCPSSLPSTSASGSPSILCTSDAHAASRSRCTVGLRLDHAGGDGTLGASGPHVCEVVGIIMLRAKRCLDRHCQLLQTGHRKAHFVAIERRDAPRGRSIGPPERHAERSTIRVLDVDVALALANADQPNQRERPAMKRVRGQDDGHGVAG